MVFISFEGIDGSGKSTQSKLLAKELGGKTVLVREPGGTTASEAIRTLLANPQVPLNHLAELLLFCAARAQLFEEVIEPALAAGQDVVADRFSDSTIAYQGFGRGQDPGMIEMLCAAATKDTWPVLTLLMRIEPEFAAERSRGKDRFESEGLEFQRRVAAGYDELAARFPERIKVIDAEGSVNEVHARVLEVVRKARG